MPSNSRSNLTKRRASRTMSEPGNRLLTIEEMLDECEALGRFRAEARALDAWTDELTDRAFALEKLMDKLAVGHAKAAEQRLKGETV